MKQIIVLLSLIAGWCDVLAAQPSTNPASTDRILLIDSSSMPVAGGKATLIIGPLQRTNGIYAGDYHLKVFPYFLNNENGRLAIVVSDATLAEAGEGKAVAITGTATTSGKDGKSRHVDATATPADTNHGTLNLSFMAGDRKMIFEPAYHFAEAGTAPILALTTKSKS